MYTVYQYVTLYHGDLLLRGRVDGGELLSADRVHELVVDEQLGVLDLGIARHLAGLF